MTSSNQQGGGLVVALLILIIVISAVGYLLWQDYQRFRINPLPISGEAISYRIKPGDSLAFIANDLKEKDILKRAFYLRLLAYDLGVSDKIKAGEYLIKTGTTAEGLLDQFVRGRIIEYSLRLAEGWTFQQALEAVRAHPMLVQTLGDVLSTEQIMEQLGFPGQHPEGRFFPDTYKFNRGMTDAMFLKRAYKQMQDVINEEWKDNNNQMLQTSYEALILASIIEKETGIDAEREKISGVFTRRLQKGMLLQADPSVIYGMGTKYQGKIYRSDLQRDTDYNTYTRAGLTPTPICLPSRASIKAALNPDTGNALYFVADGRGGHVFSETIHEHNAAVQRYRALQQP